MPAFLHDDVLLGSATAKTLFHEVAEHEPIVDVHNHLSPADVAADRRWDTLTSLWLDDDHYKWRAMRHAGVAEELITGAGVDPWDRFAAWAATVPRAIGNPLHMWTHLELRRVFGIDVALRPATAREIYDEANRQLREQHTAQSLLQRFDVRLVATTDDPADPLPHHVRHRGGTATRTALVPTFRPDAAHRLLDTPEAWNAWRAGLTATTGVDVDGLDALLGALTVSYARMASLGCRASDHGLATLPDRVRDPVRADAVVRAAIDRRPAADADRELVLLEVVSLAARLAHADDAVLQLHLGPLRNVSPRLLSSVGRDAGADVMGDERHALGLARFLGAQEEEGALPRTILYNLNPADNALFATMAGAFSRPGVESLVQWGPPWWFNDHEDGMHRQLLDLAQIGQLAGFVGMLTDSRSILSMTRHELFRRVLCDLIGTMADSGRVPLDLPWLREVVHLVCVGNAVTFFGFPAEWALRR